MNKTFGVSIILPTLNEKDNLKFLIPSILTEIQSIRDFQYEILVVDDNSNDGTAEYITKLNNENSAVKLFLRKDTPSLPMAIWDGINNAEQEYVMWLDADGSMPADTVIKLIKKQKEFRDAVVIGSRFAQGGGYKGIRDIGNDSFFSAIKNVRRSRDSVSGMIFSTLFNYILNYLHWGDIKDITSGFIIGPKPYFKKIFFLNSSYGEYFIHICNYLLIKEIKVIEIGYICETRISGTSKTASNIIQLFQRGIPYIKTAINSKKENYEDS
jgi:glycosyltransferase involved in cell wall biosynthesis